MQSVAIIVFPGFQILHIAISTIFEFANQAVNKPFYDVRLISEGGGLVTSSAGVSVISDPFDKRMIDTIIIVGGTHIARHSPALLNLLKRAASTSKRIVGACTGAFALADAGLLDGRRATTHWFHARAFSKSYPTVTLQPDRMLVVDGQIWTSAGGTAAVDVALALIEVDLGYDIAASVAKQLVMPHHRIGGQLQFSTQLAQESDSARIQATLAWTRDNLKSDLSVPVLARVAGLGTRHFTRVFHQEIGEPPARTVELLRVEAAKRMIEEGRDSVHVVATQTGFGSHERMRRAFLRVLGQPPQSVRRAAHLQTPPAEH